VVVLLDDVTLSIPAPGAKLADKGSMAFRDANPSLLEKVGEDGHPLFLETDERYTKCF